MENNVATVAPIPDPSYGQGAQRQDAASPAPAVPSQDPVDLRLVIEEDKASGSYVYKTVNRVTGEVLRQFPRDDILKLHEQIGYEAGAVIQTKA